MKLRLRTFERSIRRKFHALESEEWKNQRRRGHFYLPPRLVRSLRLSARDPRQYHVWPWLVRCGIAAIGAVALFYKIKSIDTLIALILLFAVGTIFWRASQLLIALVSSARLQVFAYLPLSNAEVFKLQWGAWLRNASWSLVDFTAIYGLLAAKAGCGWNSLPAGLAMSVAQCLVVVSLAACLVAFFPRRRFGLLVWPLVLPAAGLVFGGAYTHSIVDWLVATAHWVPPMGWILYAMGITGSRGFPGDLWPALAIGLVLALLPKAYRRLRLRYAMPEFGRVPEKTQVELQAPRLAEAYEDTARHDAVRERIKRREFLAGLHWERLGWLERLVSRWLTPEEQLTAEFLSAGKLIWTKGLVNVILIFAGAATLVYAFPRLASFSPFLSFYLLAYAAQVLYIKIWPGIALRQIGGNSEPLYCVYPVGFWPMIRVMVKTNTIRMLVLVPVFLIAAYLMAAKSGRNVSTLDLRLGLKVTCAVLCLQPVFAIMSLSSGTNDTRSPKLLLLFLAAIGIVGVCGVYLFLTQSLVLVALLAVVLLGVSLATMWIYGRAYNRNWFDLQRKPDNRQKSATP